MESGMRSIGRLARESGLTVSALRFYDGAAVFGPAEVDPQTGYRWYAPEQLSTARLLARLRRVGLPLAQIRLVLAAPPGSAAAHRVLDAHLRRLEDGLADARRELSLVHDLIDQRELLMTEIVLDRAEFAAALAAVRFAVSADPGKPVLGGILLDLDGEVLRAVATDRYRLAVGQAAVRSGADGEFQVLLPAALADRIRTLALAGEGELRLTVEGARVVAEVPGAQTVSGERLDLDFPDYRRLLRLEPTHRALIGAEVLRRAVTQGPSRPYRPEPGEPAGAPVDLTVLSLGGDGELRVVGEPGAGEGEGEVLRVAVNRDFLLEALAAGDAGTGQLLLELGGPIGPLAIRSAATGAGHYSVLMPVRLT
ncbi:DNA polymerase III subunit beta [Streptomyces tateyamensis]|uniref:DNA polymerase III subunit beta n=1 Tax=Streptomyces tateyamensis TaxID=565073 RepID=A0A2V4PNQ5_9ACTN|nr:MerR family transcriptional regulator [Streptomyces tateyamensis]PYC87934.1 DNA polymerase III subunit beta [Streptomyces tateyamensis]